MWDTGILSISCAFSCDCRLVRLRVQFSATAERASQFAMRLSMASLYRRIWSPISLRQGQRQQCLADAFSVCRPSKHSELMHCHCSESWCIFTTAKPILCHLLVLCLLLLGGMMDDASCCCYCCSEVGRDRLFICRRSSCSSNKQ